MYNTAWRIIVKNYFKKNSIDILLMGCNINPIFVIASSGEALNCKISKDYTGLIFLFNNKKKSKYFIGFDIIENDSKFNFQYWFSNSAKKKILIFRQKKIYFQRYNIENTEFVPIFTDNLERSYFVFKIEKALLFRKKMLKNGIDLEIIKEWKYLEKTY